MEILDDPAVWTAVAARAVGRAEGTNAWTAEPVAYDWASLATAGLWIVRFDDSGHEVFVKLLRHPRLWPELAFVPEPVRQDFVDFFPWTFDLDMMLSGIDAALPNGMRTPVLHHVHRPDDDHAYFFSECVAVSTAPWSIADFARTAYLLGALAARRRLGAPLNESLPAVCFGPRDAMRYYVEGRVLMGAVPALGDDSLWSHPVLAARPDTRKRMCALASKLPSIMDTLDDLPHTFAHGDASPQNLLIPAADRSERVVIDWGFGTPQPIGFDLGQLLVGLAHAGQLDPKLLPEVDEALCPAYLSGLADEGYEASAADVRYGYLASMAARSALTAIPYEALGEDADLVARRLELTDAMLDLAEPVLDT